MSPFENHTVAKLLARLMQQGITLNASRFTARVNQQVPQFPRHTSELRIPTSVGPARAVLYKPEASSNQASRVYVNFHGSGFVLPITDMEDPICRALATLAGAWVLNVDYALAPQHPFPAAPWQAYEVMKWAAAEWPNATLIAGGQSAGGALAAAASRLALEEGEPRIALQVLHYAPFDLAKPVREKTSPLARPMLRPWMGDVFNTCYVPEEAERLDRLASPANAADTADLTGIAPALIIACQQDILLEEAQRYAARLKQCGALAEYVELEGVDHGYDIKGDARAVQTWELIASHVKRALRPEA